MSTLPLLVIAIDGPSGVGKTTVARGVAQALGLPYLETGAMYRAIGLAVLEAGVDPDDGAVVEALAGKLRLDVELGAGGVLRIVLDGEEPGDRLRSPRVSDATSRIAVHPGVRARLVERQRELAGRWGGVVEGRDIGTRVFPDTPHKFFLTASDAVRLDRRRAQLAAAGRTADAQALEAEVRHRDERDRQRRESPLTWDDSYRVIDTGKGSAEQVVREIVDAVRERAAAAPLTPSGSSSSSPGCGSG